MLLLCYFIVIVLIEFIGSIVIRQHPQNVILVKGSMLNLSITASGPGNSFTYQWKKQGGTFPTSAHGKKTSNFKINSVMLSDSGSYYCLVMNQWGNMVNSNNATVNVLRMLLIMMS